MTELVVQAIANLRANKLRSFLTMFGIIWGVVSIVVLAAMGEGFQRGNQKVLEELGKNIVIVRNGRTSTEAGGQRSGRSIRLTLADVKLLAARARLVEHVSPELMRASVKVKSAFNSSALQMSGVWPVFQEMRTIQVDRGRLLNEEDSAGARRVVVIGHEASRLLFADRDPIGHTVQLDGLSYTVVGCVRKKDQDSSYTGQDDERLFVPYEAMRRDFPLTGEFDTRESLSAIIALPYAHVSEALSRQIEHDRQSGIFALDGRTPVEREIRAVLAGRHRFDPDDMWAISFWNTALESAMFGRMIGAMDEFFLSVSVVTLLLGGIGVMNIMLIAVRERTREIGVRKALGATPAMVQWQFLSEGLFLTLSSGAIGFLVAWGLCALVNLLPLPARFSGMILTWPTVTFSIAALAAIGAAASTYPARRAAALQPVEALRFDT
jgi:putative ABC transport system permease protein